MIQMGDSFMPDASELKSTTRSSVGYGSGYSLSPF
jgi:hypothetical protein